MSLAGRMFSDSFAQLTKPGRKQMTSDKAQRDALNNQRFQDIYIHASQEPWIGFYPGITFKLLRATQETGHWTVLLNARRGPAFPATSIWEPVSTTWFPARWR
jgi:hypothetical protein